MQPRRAGGRARFSPQIQSEADRAAPLPSPARALLVVLLVVILLDVGSNALVLAMAGRAYAWPALAGGLILAAAMVPVLYLGVHRRLQRYLGNRDLVLQQLLASEQRFRDIAENAKEWIWEVDAEGRYTYASPVVEQILGYSAKEVLGKHFYDLFHPDDRESLREAAFAVFESRQAFRDFINRNVHKNGQTVWLATSGIPVVAEDGRLLGYRGADTVKHDEASVTDLLTGVLNRQGFFLLAEPQMAMSVRSRLQVALLFADMDNLKEINDRFGHQEGDRAIVDAARIIKACVRGSDTVSRYGGDEFVVLLSGASKQDVGPVVLQHIQQALADFNRRGQRPYALSLSAAVAVYRHENPETIEVLISRADREMYAVKRRKRLVG